MDIYEILKRFGQRYKLERLGFDQRGRCALLVDQDVEMFLQKIGEGEIVYMYSPLMKIPEDGKRWVLATLLKANLFGQGTRGASFAVNKETQEIYFHRIMVMKKVSYELFMDCFQDAIDQVRYWRERINRKMRSGNLEDEDVQEGFWRQI